MSLRNCGTYAIDASALWNRCSPGTCRRSPVRVGTCTPPIVNPEGAGAPGRPGGIPRLPHPGTRRGRRPGRRSGPRSPPPGAGEQVAPELAAAPEHGGELLLSPGIQRREPLDLRLELVLGPVADLAAPEHD